MRVSDSLKRRKSKHVANPIWVDYTYWMDFEKTARNEPILPPIIPYMDANSIQYAKVRRLWKGSAVMVREMGGCEMITAKYYTPEEGGHWTPFPFKISKDEFDGYEQKLLHAKIIIRDFSDSGEQKVECASIMFSDGSVYDCMAAKYREWIPLEHVIEYMNTTLKDAYEK